MKKKFPLINEPVSLVRYNPKWPEITSCEISLLKRTLPRKIIGIEHHGSTAVPGLAAKPIIDILVGVKEPKLSQRTRTKLKNLGYQYIGRRLGTERLYLIKRGKSNFNLAVVKFNGPLWHDNLNFRNFLRQQPKQAAAYEKKKRQVLASGNKSLFEYSDAKTAFIEQILKRAKINLKSRILN